MPYPDRMRPIQPYQQGLATNQPGFAMQAMRRGRTLYGQNPADIARQMGAIPGSLRYHMIVSGQYGPQQQAQQAQAQQVQGQSSQQDVMAHQAALQAAMQGIGGGYGGGRPPGVGGYNPNDPRWKPPYR